MRNFRLHNVYFLKWWDIFKRLYEIWNRVNWQRHQKYQKLSIRYPEINFVFIDKGAVAKWIAHRNHDLMVEGLSLTGVTQ